MSLTLYGNKICPFAHRALITAAERGVAVQYEHIPLGAAKPEWYVRDVNPRGTVPSLKLASGKVLLESMFVAHYLDESAEGGESLMPSDPESRYAVRFFIDDFGSSMGAMYGLLKNQDPEADAGFKEKIAAGMQRLNAALLESSPEGPFFLGDQFSFADVAVWPFIARFKHTLSHFRGVDILAGDGLDRVRAWAAACEERPSFKSTTLAPEEFISQYSGYAGDRGVSAA